MEKELTMNSNTPHLDEFTPVQEFKRKYLSGTTCSRHCRIVASVGDYYIVKHDCHIEYVNRMTGSVSCVSYHVPVLKVPTNPRMMICVYAEQMPGYTRGRMNNTKWNEMLKAVNIDHITPIFIPKDQQ